MTRKKCSLCDREVFSPNETECGYCLGRIVLPGEGGKLNEAKQPSVLDYQPGERPEHSPSDRLTQQLGLMIEAQNRTTFAVRALVKFIFFQLLTLCGGALLWAMGMSTVDTYQCTNFGKTCSGNVFFLTLSVITLLSGTSISFREGWKELKASSIHSYLSKP